MHRYFDFPGNGTSYRHSGCIVKSVGLTPGLLLEEGGKTGLTPG